MKKKMLGVIAFAAIAIIAGWNYNQNKNNVNLSDLALNIIKNMKQYSLFIFIFLLFVQCGFKSDSYIPYKFDVQKEIVCKAIDYPDIIGIGLQLLKVDSFLIINDFHGDSLLTLFNLNNHTISHKLISKGNGPNEMISPLDVSLCDGNLYILSRSKFRFGHISVQDLNKKNIEIKEQIQLPQKSDCFLPLNNNTFIFSGMWDKRYALFQKEKNSNNSNIVEFGEYPDFWEKEKDFPNSVKAMFHQCKFVKHPTLPLFATCSNYVLEIYTYKEDGICIPELLFKKQLGFYNYTFTHQNIITAKNSQTSSPEIKGIACSDKYLYLIRNTENSSYKKEILVVDWKGNPIQLLQSYENITNIVISEKEKRAYCLVLEPEFQLKYFDL